MKVGFVGCGRMAEAMIASFLESKLLAPHEISGSDTSAERRELLKKSYGINMYSRNAAVVGMSGDVLILAVKPQQLDEVLTEIGPAITAQNLVFSIAAGKRISRIASFLPQARIIRVMPNLPCTVQAGASAFAMGPGTGDDERKVAIQLLSCFGRVIELPEDQFDAVTALSGSGPAFYTFFMNAMVDAAVREGLSRENALLLAEQTMLGTAKLLMQRNLDPQELIRSVASARGTTAAGLEVLNAAGVTTAIADTIRAAAHRSRELSQ